MKFLERKIVKYKELYRFLLKMGMVCTHRNGTHEKWHHPEIRERLQICVKTRSSVDRSQLRDVKSYIIKHFGESE